MSQGHTADGGVDLLRLDAASGGYTPNLLHTIPPHPQVTAGFGAEVGLIDYTQTVLLGVAQFYHPSSNLADFAVFRQETHDYARSPW